MVFFVAFLFVERAADNPLVPFSVFDNRNRVMTFVTLFLAGGVMLTLTVMIGLLVQDVLGYRRCRPGSASSRSRSPSGWAPRGGRLAPHIAPRWLIIGGGLFVWPPAVRLDADPRHPVLP